MLMLSLRSVRRRRWSLKGSKMLLRFLIIFFLVLAKSVFAQYDYKFIYDSDLSSNVGAADLVTFHKILITGEDFLLKPTLFSGDDFLSKSGGIGYRLAKIIFLDAPVDMLLGVMNHEYFGHGWRLREFGRTEIKYDISAPPPYGDGHGATHLGTGSSYTSDEDIAMRIAGSQANSTISEELRNVFIETGRIHFRQAFAYLGGIGDLISYILKTSKFAYSSNDISYYGNLVQRRNPTITVRMLKSNVLLNFANPFLLYSFYSFFDRYLIYGEDTISYPMIHVLNVNYLPSFRFGLTPFGAELRMENLVKTSSRIFNFYIAYDGYGHFTSYRSGVEAHHIFKNELLDIGGKVEVWEQPQLFLSSDILDEYAADSAPASSSMQTFGVLFLANINIHPFSKKSGLFIETGIKSSGFTEKEQLAGGFILRGGFTINM
jgi:hypothetical protein